MAIALMLSCQSVAQPCYGKLTVSQDETVSGDTLTVVEDEPTTVPANPAVLEPTETPMEIQNTPVAEPEPTGTPTVIEPTALTEGEVTSGYGIEGNIEPTIEPTMVPEDAKIRILFTSDLHGQVTTVNYENGLEKKEGSIARVSTLIQQARAESGMSNTFLFDVGDLLYDYSSDYIYEHNDAEVQPIYNVLKSFNYDAITLGNHEFDYGLSYIENQLQSSEVAEKVVLSNVRNAITGKCLWNENKIIERMVTTASGSSINIKIGIIGETIPVLSKRTEDYTGVLTTEDIVENTRKEAAILKENGAQMIVVLAHSGIGVENPALKAENAAYALTKLEDVDVVLCGHQHKEFPSDKADSASFYKLSGVDKETGLANGKTLIMAPDQGKAIGVADLDININANGIDILNRTSELRHADSSVAIDYDINLNGMGEWRKVLEANYSTLLGEIQEGINYNNYFGLLEDSPLMQLVNDAKMEAAINIVNNVKTKYKNYPIVAYSRFEKYGMDDSTEYIGYTKDLPQACLSRIQRYKTALYFYQVTGAQLKEWIEWCASAYNTTGDNTKFQVSSEKQNVLQEEWEKDWHNFFVFDGVEYEIDTTVDPRYNFDGKKISENHRVRSVTRNGAEVKDDDIIIMAGDKMFSSSTFETEIAKTKVYTGTERVQNLVKDYIERVSLNGSLKMLQDNNWTVYFADGDNYVVSSGMGSQEYAKTKEWVVEELGDCEKLKYYRVDFSKKQDEDNNGPSVVTVSLNTEITNNDITVKVFANDKNGIRSLKYIYGRFNSSASVWNYATAIENQSFVANVNGIYSILAEDNLGNKTIRYVRITNINKGVLEAPTVDSVSNKTKYVTGKAEPGAVIYCELESGKVYKKTVSDSGSFKLTIAMQKAGKKLYLYVIDKEGRSSARITVSVQRKGPNKPTMQEVYSNSLKISAKLNDKYVTPVFIVDEKKVYVPQDSTQLFLNSSLCAEGYVVRELPFQITDTLATVKLPLPLSADVVVRVNCIDSLGRVSVSSSTTVKAAVPNKPSTASDVIANNATNVKVYTLQRTTVHIKVNGTVYTNKTSGVYVGEDQGYMYTVSIPKTNSGVILDIYATNRKGNSSHLKVKRIQSAPNTPKITAYSIKKQVIKGEVNFIDSENHKSTLTNSKTKVYVKIGGKVYKAKVNNEGEFTVRSKKIKKYCSVVIWATNVNGTGCKGTKILR